MQLAIALASGSRMQALAHCKQAAAHSLQARKQSCSIWLNISHPFFAIGARTLRHLNLGVLA
jgi:hypothetical protein